MGKFLSVVGVILLAWALADIMLSNGHKYAEAAIVGVLGAVIFCVSLLFNHNDTNRPAH